MEEKAISIVGGIVLFAIGLWLLSWSNNNSTGDEIDDFVRPDYGYAGYGAQAYSGTYLGLVIGFVLLCAGSIFVGGAAFGWEMNEIFGELQNVGGTILEFAL